MRKVIVIVIINFLTITLYSQVKILNEWTPSPDHGYNSPCYKDLIWDVYGIIPINSSEKYILRHTFISRTNKEFVYHLDEFKLTSSGHPTVDCPERKIEHSDFYLSNFGQHFDFVAPLIQYDFNRMFGEKEVVLKNYLGKAIEIKAHEECLTGENPSYSFDIVVICKNDVHLVRMDEDNNILPQEIIDSAEDIDVMWFRNIKYELEKGGCFFIELADMKIYYNTKL